MIAVVCAAGGAQAAERVYHATYEGSYFYKAVQTGSGITATYTDKLSWTMKISYEFPRGTIKRSLVVQGSHVSVKKGGGAFNDFNCTLKRAPVPRIPITLFIGDTVDKVNVGVEIPASAGPGGSLTATGTNCALTDLRGGTAADGSQNTGSCASFPPTPAFELQQGVSNAPAGGYTKKIDLDQTAKPTGGCLNGSTFTATRSIHARITVGGGPLPGKPTPPAKSNPKPKKSPPKKKSGLEIIDLTTGRPATESTLPAIVGQLTKLRVKTKNGTPPRDPRWDVPGGGGTTRAAAIRDYEITSTSGKVEFLSRGDLNDDVVSFHVVKPGEYRVNVSASGDSEWVKLDVASPTVDPKAAQLCPIGVATISHNDRLGGTLLGLGYTDPCPNMPGIQWSFIVRTPQSGAGHIAMTQLIAKEVQHSSTTVNGVVEKLHTCAKLTTTTLQADEASFYDQLNKPASIWMPEIAAGGTAH